MQHTPPRSPLIVPLSKWKRSNQQSCDAAPTPLISEISPTTPPRSNNEDAAIDDYNRTDDDEAVIAEVVTEEHKTTKGACAVCSKHESRYNCPRCQLPYCSVECYRTHTTTTTTGVINEEASTSSPCTEAFYKNRVTEILRLEVVEQHDTTRQILNRQYHQQLQQNNNDNSNKTEYLDNDENHMELSEEELYDVLLALDEQEQQQQQRSDVGEESTVKDLQNLLSPTLRAAFERALQEGEISNLVVQPWNPWWRPEFASNIDDKRQDDAASSLGSGGGGKTLDERLLRIPPFTTLRKGPTVTSPLLIYNLVELVYSIAWMLRLYNGPANALGLPVEATTTLITSSTVLGGGGGKEKDGGGGGNGGGSTYSTLEQVLSDCTTRSTRRYPSDGCNAHWTTLTEDASLMSTSHRHIGRSLLDAMDIVKAAINILKTQRDDGGSDKEEDNVTQHIGQLRRIRKKIEFYLSFSQQEQQQHVDIGIATLKNDIFSWMESWKLSDPNDDSEGLQELVLPATNEQEGMKALKQRRAKDNHDKPLPFAPSNSVSPIEELD